MTAAGYICNTESMANGYGKRPLWQWVVIYLVIGGVIYAGIYYFFLAKKGGYNSNQSGQYQTQQPTSQQQASPTTTQASPTVQQSQNTVTLTANGFSPASLTIKAGQTITWMNKSGEGAAVNSDPHPVHTTYPPLNLGSFPDGGTLTLTFDKPGTYGYHNHLNSSERGTITVQ